MDENTTPIDVDAEFSAAFAEQTPTEDAPTAAAPQVAPTPAGDGTAETGGTQATAAASPPPTTTETDKPAKAESDLEARVRKAENDAALARKAQAAADRRLFALTEAARIKEAEFIQGHIDSGTLTQEVVKAAPQRMQGYVEYQESQAQRAEAQAEAQRLQAETHAAREDREAEIAFKEQAIPLFQERASLGLSEADVDPQKRLEELLKTKYAEDVADTWEFRDKPDRVARIYERMMTAAKADVTEEMKQLADAKRTTQAGKAAVNRYDRTSSPGPSSGGSDPLPTLTPDEHFAAHFAQSR